MLDIGTTYIVTACALIGLALLQTGALATRLVSPWLGWWAASNLLLGGGTMLLGLQTQLPFWSVHAANALTTFGYLTLVASIRSFGGASVQWHWMALLGTALSAALIAAFPEPDQFALRVTLICAFNACCDALIIREGRALWQRERLTSARLLVVLFAVSGALWLFRCWLALSGQIGPRLLTTGSDVSHWMMMAGAIFVTLRGIVLLFMMVERNQNALQMLAWSDPLTGALNRAGLANAFDAAVRSTRRTRETTLSLVMIDLDRFKAINDSRGHAAGDVALKQLVQAVRRCLPEAAIGRFGGDEFAVLVQDSTLRQPEADIARIRETFAAGVSRQQLTSGLSATLSIGIAQGPARSANLDHLIALADKALYESKSRGRDRVSFASMDTISATTTTPPKVHTTRDWRHLPQEMGLSR